jgi:hypothetical protein
MANGRWQLKLKGHSAVPGIFVRAWVLRRGPRAYPLPNRLEGLLTPFGDAVSHKLPRHSSARWNPVAAGETRMTIPIRRIRTRCAHKEVRPFGMVEEFPLQCVPVI